MKIKLNKIMTNIGKKMILILINIRNLYKKHFIES